MRVTSLSHLAGLALAGFAAATSAATFTVTKTADTNDGTCDADCSLREAIVAANTTAGGPHTVSIPAGTYTLTIAGTNENAGATGDLDITADVTVTGVGASTTIVDGGALDRVFDIRSPAAAVTISGITIRNGNAGSFTGGILGGGINTAATSLQLANVVVTANTAEAGAGIAGTAVTLTGSVVSNNIVSLNNSGAGVRVTTLVAVDSTISGNSAGGQGAGIFATNVTLDRSTVSGNTSVNSSGGGLFVSNGTVTVTNSTISANSAANGVGGGFRYLPPPAPPFPAVTFESTTVANNTAGSSGGGIQIGQGGGILSLRNSIVAGSSAAAAPDCDDVNSQGNNLIQNTSGCTITGTTTGNITGVSPQLGPLASNGGPTQTHGLLAGSPAIDAANPVGAPATDQRGVTRPVGAGFDIGSFEGTLGGAPLPTLVINSVTANEGNAGTTTFAFTVTLSAASASNVTVDFATADGTATAGSDYTTAAGTLTFTPGQTTQAINVSVLGDVTVEANESFVVNLSNASGATIATGQGTGTITNDDQGTTPPPATPAAPIPTLSQWALLLLALMLGGMAWRQAGPRRRR